MSGDDQRAARSPRDASAEPRDLGSLCPLFDAMPQLGWAADPDGWIFYYNQQWYEYTGTTLENTKGWGWECVHDPVMLAEMKELWQRCLATGQAFEAAFPIRRYDGVFRWFLTRAKPVRDDAGTIVRWIGINTDIDDQKRAEQRVVALAEDHARALREAEQVRTVAEIQRERATLGASIGRALVTTETLDVQLRSCCEALIVLGAAFARIWTYNSSQEVLDLRASAGLYTHLDGDHAHVPLGAFKIGRIAQRRLPHLTNAVADDPEVSDHEWARREGMVAFAGYPLVVGDRLVGVMALFATHELAEDTLIALGSVADQIALGIERDHSERSRELFIGILGHDLRNPLSSIDMSASRLRIDAALPERHHRIAERIQSSAARMARMISQVLDFTRARSVGGIPIFRSPGDLHVICAHAVDELASAHPTRVIESTYLGDGRGAWDADRLEQVFSNLVGNALSYGATDTAIRVVIDARTELVRCTVQNTGTPIPEAALSTIFDPFRRASDANRNRGLGLGLFISHEIVVAHGGTISVESTAANGTEMTITLPRT
jgi:PAS domain S-box-containing protein